MNEQETREILAHLNRIEIELDDMAQQIHDFRYVLDKNLTILARETS